MPPNYSKHRYVCVGGYISTYYFGYILHAVDRLLVLLAEVLHVIPDGGTYWIRFPLFCLSMFGLLWFFAIKTWLLFYNIKFNEAVQNNIWLKDINKEAADTNWFIKNHLKYDRFLYILGIAAIPYSISCLIASFASLSLSLSLSRMPPRAHPFFLFFCTDFR